MTMRCAVKVECFALVDEPTNERSIDRSNDFFGGDDFDFPSTSPSKQVATMNRQRRRSEDDVVGMQVGLVRREAAQTCR